MLWVRAEWGVCADVLEHLPPDRVATVLTAIRDPVTKGAFFQVALFHDCWFGEVFHLTVRPAFWWQDLFRRLFPYRQARLNGPDRLILTCRKGDGDGGNGHHGG